MKIYRIKQILKGLGRRKVGGEEGLIQNKAAMFEFMERYPVRKMEAGRQKIKEGGLILTLKPMPIIVGIIIATLLAGGGTAYASQSSLPGDALYTVKLMAEDVQIAVAWGSEKKVELEAKFANRRLEEIQKLQERLKKKKGEISPGVVEKAMERAEEKLNKAESRISKMEDGVLKDKALESASHLEEALRDHEQLLSDLAGEIPDKAEQALFAAQAKSALHAERALGVISRLEKRQELKDKIREKAKEEAGKIMGAEERAEGKLGAIENKLEAAENYLENLKEQGRDVSNYEAKLEEAKTKLDEAKKLLEEGKYLESFQAANEVMRALIEAKGILRPIIMPVEEESDETSASEPDESTVSPETESVETGEPGEASETGEAVQGTITPLPTVLPVVR